MKISIRASRYVVLCLSAVMAACIQLDPLASERLADGAAAPATIGSSDQLEPGSPTRVDAALRHLARLQAEREQNERRKAAEILGFFAIKQGMVVLDLYSGGGSYVELLSNIVGPTGRVVVHNKMPYLSFAQHELAAGMDNAEQPGTEHSPLKLAANVFDVVIMIKSYHDVYFVSEDEGWVKIDRSGLLSEIFTTLKPGGVLGIVDFKTEPADIQARTDSRSRRVDPAIIKRDMAVVGFVFDEEIDVLHRSGDGHSQSVFMPPDRDQANSIIFRFHKP